MTRVGPAIGPAQKLGGDSPEIGDHARLWEGTSLNRTISSRTFGAQKAFSKCCQTSGSKQWDLWEQNKLWPYPCNCTLGSTENFGAISLCNVGKIMWCGENVHAMARGICRGRDRGILGGYFLSSFHSTAKWVWTVEHRENTRRFFIWCDINCPFVATSMEKV